jgi:hypothetical protein
MAVNKQVLLAARPQGAVKETDFRLVETPMPRPADGQVLVRSLYLSLDPYMRGRMNAGRNYTKGVELGEVMTGEAIGEIVETRHAKLRVGDKVQAHMGWQQFAAIDGDDVQPIAPGPVPLTAHLGAVGMPGVTAWIGLLDIGQPKPGETVAVSAASGAVGSAVGQIARIKGCRAVGIAGGKAKCDYVVRELGFDACVDYKAGNLARDLEAATPKGVDIYFENVGGEVFNAVLPRLNDFARIPVCGLVAQNNSDAPVGMALTRQFLVQRLKMQGFICSDTMDRWPIALRDLSEWVAAGHLKYRETIAEGLENAPRAFIGLLRGENFGKQLVRIS